MQKTSVGRVQENDKGFPCAGLSVGRKACHVPLNYLSFIFPVNSVSDISGLAVYRLDLLVYPPTMPSAAGRVWLSKCLSHLTVMEQQTGFCGDCAKCDCLDFDEDAINFDLYLSSAAKRAGWKGTRQWHRVLIPHFSHMRAGQESCSESH